MGDLGLRPGKEVHLRRWSNRVQNPEPHRPEGVQRSYRRRENAVP
jgi:hypothetical protein